MPDWGVGGGKWRRRARKISCRTGLVIAKAAAAGEWGNSEAAGFRESRNHGGTNRNRSGRFGVCDSGTARVRENVYRRAHDL